MKKKQQPIFKDKKRKPIPIKEGTRIIGYIVLFILIACVLGHLVTSQAYASGKFKARYHLSHTIKKSSIHNLRIKPYHFPFKIKKVKLHTVITYKLRKHKKVTITI